MNKIIVAHNALTSYKPKNFIHSFINYWSKCQNKSIYELYNEGVRGFDIRVACYPDKIIACHGFVRYEVNILDILALLNELGAKVDNDVYVRLVNEDTFYNSSKVDFDKFVEQVKYSYPNIILQTFDSKKNWSMTENEWELEEFEMIGSKFVPTITPKTFSRVFNETIKRLYNKLDKGAVYMDFL